MNKQTKMRQHLPKKKVVTAHIPFEDWCEREMAFAF